MQKYNQETKDLEDFKGADKVAIPRIEDVLHTTIKEGVFDISTGKRIDKQDAGLVKYFTRFLQDDKRAKTVVHNITILLSESETKELSNQLQTIKFKASLPSSKYDEVTSEVTSKLEQFVELLKSKELTVVESLKESDTELYQELREAFVKGKILKNRLKDYFRAIYGANLSAKTILAQLRVIDPKLFADGNLKNKKKALASYLLG